MKKPEINQNELEEFQEEITDMMVRNMEPRGDA